MPSDICVDRTPVSLVSPGHLKSIVSVLSLATSSLVTCSCQVAFRQVLLFSSTGVNKTQEVVMTLDPRPMLLERTLAFSWSPCMSPDEPLLRQLRDSLYPQTYFLQRPDITGTSDPQVSPLSAM